jgi:hypothetical protein
MKKEYGQVILILVLIMTVALAIGISVIQRSLSDISTSNKVEQSTKAFSAAEAGIEKALKLNSDTTVDFAENNSSATVTGGNLIPAIPAVGTRQDPFEYPPLAREEVAHIWLADLNSTASPPALVYTQPSIDIYWGDPIATDKAALELTFVYYDSALGKYLSRKWFLDQTVRTPVNNFDNTANCTGLFTFSSNSYKCKKTLGDNTGINNGPLPSGSMLIRARLLYNTTSQPFAVQAVGTCGTACSIPPQARKLISIGISGQAQRKVQLFQILKVVPPFFDYAIFSAADINK